MAALALSPIATTLGNGVFTSQEVQAATVPADEDAGEVFYISNEEIFDRFEEQGYNVKSILGEEEYHSCLMQDLMRAGGTYIKPTKNGFTLYLNSAICKLAVWGGAAALGSAVASALTSIGAGGATTQAVKQIVKTVIKNAGTKATKRGVRIRFSTKGKMISWGYQ